MKNFKFIILTICIAAFISCEKDNGVDYIHEKSPEARITEKIEAYSKILTKPAEGWIGYYSPNKFYGAFTLLANFDENGSVLLNSDFNAGGDSNGSVSYRLDKTDNIELVFESHGLLHEIFELENNGVNGDFSFNVISVTDEEIVLEGKLDPIDDITRLILKPAKKSDWDLDPIYKMIENLNGDINKSYFRNVLHNDNRIASFKFNAATRLCSFMYPINEFRDSIIIQPVSIKPNGIEFLLKPEVNNVVLKGEFLYDESTAAFINAEENLKIIYDDIPVTLEYYGFGLKNNIRYNYLEPEKSSQAFTVFLDEYYAFLEGYGVSISRIYMRDLTSDDPYLHIYTNYGNIWASVTYEVKEDGKVYFELTGESNVNLAVGEFWHTLLNPLFEVIIGSEKGYFIENTGGLLNYSNGTVTLINADEPKYTINYYDF
jgi:hypothetical protein